MSLKNTISHGLKKSFSFKGKATRKEYLSVFIVYAAYLLVSFVFYLLLSSCYYLPDYRFYGLFVPLNIFISVVLYCCHVRRIHDTGKNGWISAIPIVNLLFLFLPSKKNCEVRKINPASVIFGKILIIIFSFCFSIMVQCEIYYFAHDTYKSIQTRELSIKRNKEKIIAEEGIKQQIHEKEKKERLEKQHEEEILKKIEKMPAYMIVNKNDLPAYGIPYEVKNPYDSEELTNYLANYPDDHRDFDDLIYKKFQPGTIVKPLFIKKDPYGQNWVLVYFPAENNSEPEFLFLRKEGLSETDQNINPETLKSFERNDWDEILVEEYEKYGSLWPGN